MSFPLRAAAAQVDTVVGDFEGNAKLVREATERARAQGARLVAFPELTLTGYPPRDFLELASFVDRSERTLRELAAPAEWSRGLAVVVGFAERHAGEGAGVHNAAAVLQDGRVTVARKLLLPTYDVFDEGRYFDPGQAPTVATVDGVRLGVTICEDVWNDKSFWPRPRYREDPLEELSRTGIDMVLNVSASPYAMGKPALRERMLGAACRRHRVPMLYVNLVGGNDSLVFDGRSVALDAAGEVIARAPAFAASLLVAGVEAAPVPPLPAAGSAGEDQEILDALDLGLRDYAAKTGFASAVLGLSGGIDSALTAAIAARALGASSVLGVAMPSRYTADMSTEDARVLARTLGTAFEVVPIEGVFESFLGALREPFAGRPPDVTEENLQARIRGTILMALSNKRGDLLLSTGNKSELSVGYCTLYGDMAGGLAAIGDLPKTLVYRLARHLNREREVIPARTITRPPTAELRPGQTDLDSLPPYELLDEIARLSVEERLSGAEIVARGLPAADVQRVLRLLVRSEYKRRQAAPVLRVTSRAFGEGWRFPIAHRFER
ncbi:MAG TPA: NAD+ synthase [Myxococcales bacterium]|nr:NAD+ synthase [Myxococcales bacterium]